MRFFTTTTVSLGLYEKCKYDCNQGNSTSPKYKYVNMKCGLLVILPHGLYGLHDLRDFVVHHAPQHAVSNSISVHDDPGGKRIVVLQIGL